MSDRFPHTCKLGGRLTATAFERLQREIKAAGWPEVVLDEDKGTLTLMDNDGACDAYCEFLRLLRARRVAYDYVCGGRYEYTGDLFKWRPGLRKVRRTDVDANDSPILSAGSIHAILGKLDRKRCRPQTIAAMIRRDVLYDIPALPSFVVS